MRKKKNNGLDFWSIVRGVLGIGYLLLPKKDQDELHKATRQLEIKLSYRPENTQLSDTTVDDILKRGRP